MAKNIIICSDGTGNNDIKDRGTNVFKMFEAVDLNGHRFDPLCPTQVAIYDDGVGTQSLRPIKVISGVTGWGLSRNVRQLYRELSRIYDPGDRIFLFGFSRGAFTVRTLAGLIVACGIIDAGKLLSAADLGDAVKTAYRTYRSCFRTWIERLFGGKADTAAMAAFRGRFCHAEETRIAFIGVWDTVDAVGMPFHLSDFINNVFYRFKFDDRTLSDRVDRACHALAIDDERHSFNPLLWDQSSTAVPNQVIEQVWFAGAHANVGGGYPKQGMSLVALDWMMQKAADAGLRFVETDRALYRDHANVDDKLYDPRSGLGIFYRWKIRDTAAICRENGVKPVIHLSVMERIAHGTDDYAPGNLAPDATVAFTSTGDPDKDATAAIRARAAEHVLHQSHGDGKSLLTGVGPSLLLGRASYYLYLTACLALLVASAYLKYPTDGVVGLLCNTLKLIADLLLSPIETIPAIVQSFASPRGWIVFSAIATAFLLSLVMSSSVDALLDTRFSAFWHTAQQKLRVALKQAKAEAAMQARR